MAKIFIVEDDEKIRKELKTFLEKNGHFCTVANDFENIIDKVLNSDTELVLLDINLPRYDGFHICREIRKASSIPIIIVTSRDSEIDELMSINWGAYDFITKPYNTQILLARISSVLKRSYNANGTDKITYKGLTLDLSRSIIKYGDKVADLTKNEVKILYLFLQKRGVIISRNEIMDYLWQSDNFIDDNTLTVNINRIRKKLSNIGIENFLITKRGQGYMI